MKQLEIKESKVVPFHRLTDEDINLIWALADSGVKDRDICSKFDIDDDAMYKAIEKRFWQLRESRTNH